LCGGTGIDPDVLDEWGSETPPEECDYDPASYICPYCDNGEVRWGCWYGEDRGKCGSCGAENALVAGMYEDSGDYDSQWVCLACYVRHHKEQCGCDAWAWAEKKLVLFMPSD
jgi:hypothetical protein